MCGIAGIYSESPPDPALLKRMAQAIAHRGPDDEGVWTDPDAGIGFAHRRLSIVDLSASGHQPMHSANGRLVLNYNGEIYNHRAIRAELEALGSVPEGGWRGHSDTETLLQGIAVWGLEQALQRAVGMFAFALWDRSTRTLSLVRDRFGEKPLYYGGVGGDFVFGSELKSLRLHPRFDNPISRRALRQFASRAYVPAPHSIYEDISKLPPGHILELSPTQEPFRNTGLRVQLKLSSYWSYGRVVAQALSDPIEDRADALEQLERVLAAAIGDQSIADVPVGAFLSGGIDSSTITALYQQYSGTPVRTYTIGFDEAAYNEADDARRVAEHLGTVHHEHRVTSREARDVIPLLPAMYDEPFADSSQIPTFLVSRVARQDVTVALTGDGGDELFGGYNRHVSAPRLWRQAARVPQPIRAMTGAALSRIPAEFWSRAGQMFPGKRQPHFGGKVQKALKVFASVSSIDELYRDYLDEWSFERSPVLYDGGPDIVPALRLHEVPAATRLMLADVLDYLPNDILCKVDRASMAVSLETRVPFLDHRVAAVAARIPVEMKIGSGRGKLIIRELLGKHVPSELFERPKAGFAVPVGEWIKGPLRDWAEDLLQPSRMASEGWFDPSIVSRRWQDHLSGRRPSTQAIWAILMFQAWLREQNRQLAAAA